MTSSAAPSLVSNSTAVLSLTSAHFVIFKFGCFFIYLLAMVSGARCDICNLNFVS